MERRKKKREQVARKQVKWKELIRQTKSNKLFINFKSASTLKIMKEARRSRKKLSLLQLILIFELLLLLFFSLLSLLLLLKIIARSQGNISRQTKEIKRWISSPYSSYLNPKPAMLSLFELIISIKESSSSYNSSNSFIFVTYIFCWKTKFKKLQIKGNN